MNTNNQRERRRHQRSSTSLPVKIVFVHPGGLGRENTRIINVSTGGAYFGSDKELSPGLELELSISAPRATYSGYLPAEFTGSATIVRINRESPPPGKRSGIGISFNGKLTFRTVTSAAGLFADDLSRTM